MGKFRKVAIIDIDGEVRDNPDFPVAILRMYPKTEDDESIFEGYIVDPVFTDKIEKNLYGRIMTLVEATTEPSRLKAVKDVFGKEIKSWSNEVYREAREISNRAASQVE